MPIPHYDRWEDIPDLHELATKTMLAHAGYRPTGYPVATITYFPGERPAGLFRRTESKPKNGEKGLRPSLLFIETECLPLQVEPGSIEEGHLRVDMLNMNMRWHEGRRYLVARWDGQGTFLLQPLDLQDP